MTTVATDPMPTPCPPLTVRLAFHRLAFWSVLGLAAVAVGVAGLHLRRWAWDQTEPIRFVQDIDNAFRQGTRTLNTGYLERYDNENALPQDQRFWVMGLDYGPGRLAVAALWSRWVRARATAPSVGPDPALDQWVPEFYVRARQLDPYALCWPLLMFNLAGETLAAVAMFLLVRRYASSGGARPARGAILGLVAASFFWLDPALIWNAHCWPQWDSWVLPFFLWATLAASVDLWFCAGLLIAAGAMFKGQILFSSLFFLLWPLFQRRPGATGRWVAGLLSGAAAITAVWLVRSPGGIVGFLYVPGHTNPVAVRWVVDVAVAFGLVMLAVRTRATWVRRLAPVRWEGWTARDPAPHHVGAGIAMLIAGLGLMGVAIAGAVAVATGYSTVPATGLGVVALALLGWSTWFAGLMPAAWSDRLAQPPLWSSIAARVAILTMAVASVGLALHHPATGPTRSVHDWIALAKEAGHIALTTDARMWGEAASAVAVLAVAMWIVPARSVGHLAAAWLATALLLCVPLFGGSFAWFQTGIAHGTTARPMMSNGPNCNLPNLLSQVWGWSLEEPTVTLPPGAVADGVAHFIWSIDKRAAAPPPPGRPVFLPMKYLLLLTWAGLTTACAAGAAGHHRRRDARFLLAVAAPWVAMFAVLGQMHQRYLLWGAALTSMSVAVSPGLLVLHLLLSVVSAGQEMLSMIGSPARRTPGMAAWVEGHPRLIATVDGWTPGMGWAVMVIALVYVYLAATSGRRRSRDRG